MIKFEHVSLSFKDKIIFDDLNIDVEKGENVSIGGGSGIGKTSLLKLLQGYVLPDSGSILIDDEILSPKTIQAIRKKMSWIPQNINLPVNSGVDLVNLMDLSERMDSISVFLENLGLEGNILQNNFSSISGGQKQRIVISIVLSLGRNIILMDEPTSSLDDQSIVMLIQVMQSLENITIISATHNHLWMNQADKVISL